MSGIAALSGMAGLYWLCGGVAAALFVYLVVALLKAEDF